MTQCRSIIFGLPALMAAMVLLAACGGGGTDVDLQPEEPMGKRVAVVDHGPNVVWAWSQIAASTIGFAGAVPRVTPEELRPQWAVDHATVHLAIYEAANAIARTHKPFAVAPSAPTDGASIDAAVIAAAHGALKGLFPNRSALYQPPYDAMLAALPDGDAKARGVAVGAEVAAAIVALRANDGRAVVLPPFVPGTQPGDYRGANPIVQWVRFIKPFTLRSASQFRSDEPPALGSGSYAEDFNETKDVGGAGSALRTPAQTAAALAFTEGVNVFWPRNLRQFARSQPTLAENARLMAMLWVALADSAIGCWDSKYRYLRWRPISAIRLADSDGNDATVADPAWTEAAQPAPEHPEYPAAPGCVVAPVADTLAGYYGTRRVVFAFDSTAGGGSVRHYGSVDAMEREAKMARIWGGLHLRSSLARGAELGSKTARWVAKHHFTPLER